MLEDSPQPEVIRAIAVEVHGHNPRRSGPSCVLQMITAAARPAVLEDSLYLLHGLW